MNTELSRLIDDAGAVSQNVDQLFGELSGRQLNWKSEPSAWSIAQCLEHLIITNQLEFPAIRDAIRPEYDNPFWSRFPLLPAIFGRIMIWLFATESRRRVKAPKMFQPSQSELPKDIVKDFIGHQREVVDLLKQCSRLDIDRIRIVSPVSNFITYSLRDAFRVLVGHEQRHLRQAIRVAESAGFPR